MLFTPRYWHALKIDAFAIPRRLNLLASACPIHRLENKPTPCEIFSIDYIRRPQNKRSALLLRLRARMRGRGQKTAEIAGFWYFPDRSVPGRSDIGVRPVGAELRVFCHGLCFGSRDHRRLSTDCVLPPDSRRMLAIQPDSVRVFFRTSCGSSRGWGLHWQLLHYGEGRHRGEYADCVRRPNS